VAGAFAGVASGTPGAPALATIARRGRRIAIEHAWIGSEDPTAPLLVFLHEGLGCLAMWRDWPAQVCALSGCRGLVYSRYGYGRSTPRPHDERWDAAFMHDEADALAQLLATLGVDTARDPPWLVGHSDGGSIALIHAARHPARTAGVIAIAPHIVVEDVSIASIERAREAWRTTDLRERLGRYHADPESAFGGWNDAWLAPEFRAWSIEAMLADVRCPVLAVQGTADEYGTLEQIRGIARKAPQATLCVLDGCGHSPQREMPQALARTLADYISRHSRAAKSGGTP
jgi:pimeloyl-ACP methyl ester carboxylesterase